MSSVDMGSFCRKGSPYLAPMSLTVVAGEQVHAMVELVDGQEDALLALTFGGTKLRAVGEDGLAALRVLLGDVHDEGGRHAFERSGVKNFERAMRFAGERELLETGEEAAFVTERRRRGSDPDGALPSREELRSRLANRE